MSNVSRYGLDAFGVPVDGGYGAVHRGARAQRAASDRRSVARRLEPNEPVETVTVDALASDAPHGRVCKSSTTRPPSQRRENQLRNVEGAAVPSRASIMPSDRNGGSSPDIGAKQRDGSPGQVTVGNGIGRTIGPVELRKGVQLNCTAKDITVERQGLTSSTGEMDVGRRAGHGSNVIAPLRRDVLPSCRSGCEGPAAIGLSCGPDPRGRRSQIQAARKSRCRHGTPVASVRR